MSDGDGASKAGIPAWQVAHDNATSNRAPTGPAKEDDATISRSHPTDDIELQQAQTFLSHEDISNARLEDKVKFLESKDISKDIIDKAIAATTPSPSPKTLSPSATSSSSTPQDERAVSNAQDQPQQPPPMPSREDIPIITYPEFLMQAHQPPPIITVQRLLNTAYVALGAAAVTYGLSRYLVKPMSETLSGARHDFATHAQSKIADLNERLTTAVSVDPRDSLSRTIKDDGSSDVDTVDSDPTELFHRDYGTQTSPELEAPSDSSSDSDAGEKDPLEAQTNRLQRLKQICEDISAEEDSERMNAEEISVVIKVFNDQLDSLTYSKQSWSNGSFVTNGVPNQKKEDDEVARMRSTVRGMKGLFLTARNFPTTMNRVA